MSDIEKTIKALKTRKWEHDRFGDITDCFDKAIQTLQEKAEREKGCPMKLINKNFSGLTIEEFDKTINGLSGLAAIIIPFLLSQKFEGTESVEVVAEFNLDLQIAADAVEEIKQQVYGRKLVEE